MVTLISNLPRSGGTLLNRILVVSENAVVLSEINPLGFGRGTKQVSELTMDNIVQYQASSFYGISLKAKSFSEAILELIEYCNSKEIKLIIRDWTFPELFLCEENKYGSDFKLGGWRNFFKLNNVPFLEFALIREPYFIWQSMGFPKLGYFIQGSSRYLKLINGCKLITYEEIVSDPSKCASIIGVVYKKKYGLAKQDQVFGDSQLRKKRNLIRISNNTFGTKASLVEFYSNKIIASIYRELGYPFIDKSVNLNETIQYIKFTIKKIKGAN